MTETEKQLLTVNKLIAALEAQRAVLLGKTVYLERLDSYVVRKHKVTRIQVSNCSMYAPSEGTPIIDDSCTMMELRLTSQESVDWLKRTLDKTFNIAIDREVLGQAKIIGDVVTLVERITNATR